MLTDRTACKSVAVALIIVIVSFTQIVASRRPQRAQRYAGVSRQVHVDVVNATSVTLRWTAPSSSDPCQVEKFAIRLREAGVSRTRGWKLEPDRRSVSLHDLRPRTEYQLRLTTFTCDGHRRHSRWTRIYTDESAASGASSSSRHHQSRDTTHYDTDSDDRREETQAPGQPTAVRALTTADTAVVSWSPPDDNTRVRSYMIGYGEGVPDVKWLYVNGSQRNVTIQHLKPSTQYVVSVRAINRFGKGLVVYDLVYTRHAESAVRQERGGDAVLGGLPAPVNLRTTVLSARSVRLQWVDPSLSEQQTITDERYYNVYYHALPAHQNLSVIVKALQVTLHDLQPATRYRFKVRTVKGIDTSPFSRVTADRTPTDRDSADVDADVVQTAAAREHPDDDVTSVRRHHHHDDSSRTSSEQGKTKRAHHQPPPLGAQAQLAYDPGHVQNATQIGNVTASRHDALRNVAFRAIVQHRVTAYVTWPSQPECDTDVISGSEAVAGYIFRYEAIGANGGYIVRNLAVNFVVLDNLVPGMQYRYQVRYVPERGEASDWSQDGLLDTTTSPMQHQQQ